MLPESTTTTGDSLPVIHINPFHIISADVTIIPETCEREIVSLPHTCSITKIEQYMQAFTVPKQNLAFLSGEKNEKPIEDTDTN